MSNEIVHLNVTQTIAPLPPTLQQTGAFISQGGTTLAAGTKSLLTQFSDLTALLATARASSTLAWSGGTVTVTTTAPHGYITGRIFPITIAGAVPTGYNGTYLATVTGASTFTYALASNPGSNTTPGTFVSGSVAELTAMATTFFAQGSSVGVYVLELGVGSVADGVTALNTFITNNPKTVYSYIVPRFWDNNGTFLTFLTNYNATTALTYFLITTTAGTYANYPATTKCAVLFVEAPTIGATEFGAAATFWVMLHANPSPTNKVPPLAFSYVTGVTPYPTSGNGPTFSAWKLQGVNWYGTGAEGGISNTVVFWGKNADGRPWNYWYSIDWMQINVDINVANEVINGSNNPINPLYLNQDGINRVQARIYGTLTSAITFGLALGNAIQTELDALTFTQNLENGLYAGNAVVNAIPFPSYFNANPSHYRVGEYDGYSVTYTPLRGFESITININVTDFVAA